MSLCKLRLVPCLPTRHSSNTNTAEHSEPSTKDQTICIPRNETETVNENS
ncbi:hypothetical protein PAHAL_1G051300 [Panicum hallii]|uniref:Uncharacterized protein n=1 Tax=Panicum hallii TaxID=206008 RepID=A0A2T8KU68_9POAL|nr:hypothetical protein PAHAL_1G051300 [Panicum hallii]